MRADIHDGPEQMLQSKAGYIDARPLTASSAKPLATHGRTIHLGQKRRWPHFQDMSAVPPTTDICRGERHVGFVHTSRLMHRSKSRPIRSPCRSGRTMLIRAIPPYEDPQSAALRLIARPGRYTPIL